MAPICDVHWAGMRPGYASNFSYFSFLVATSKLCAKKQITLAGVDHKY